MLFSCPCLETLFRMRYGARAAAVLSLLLLPVALVEVAYGGPGDQIDFRTESSLVLVPVTVTDRGGAYIGELPRESFTVLDNRQPQPITVFNNVDAPCAMGIILDISGSVRGRLDRQKLAARAAAEMLEPADEYFLMSVSSSPGRLSGMGGDPASIANLLQGLTAGGWTALYDTIAKGLAEVRNSQRPRHALLVISDGLDNHSRITRIELTRALEEADVRVYSLAIEDTQVNRKAMALEEAQRGRVALDELARKSGGLSLRVGPGEDPAPAARRIASAIHNQYVLGYRTPRSGSGKWHTIQVKIDRQHSNVYARTGYREP